MYTYDDAPPSYQQAIGVDFNPIGTSEDLAEAARVSRSSRVYAAVRPTEESVKRMTNAQLCAMALPIFWCSAPCLIPLILNRAAILRNALYVITEDSVYIHVSDHTPPCACGCTTGIDSMEINLDSITDVQVNNQGSGCTAIRPPAVTLFLVNKQVTLLVDNTEGVAHLIRELRRANKGRQSAGVVSQQPVVRTVTENPAQGSMQQSKRIFVASQLNPADVSIVNLQGNSLGDWTTFLDETRRVLGFPVKGDLRVTLADVGASITSADQLSANDKVLVAVE